MTSHQQLAIVSPADGQAVTSDHIVGANNMVDQAIAAWLHAKHGKSGSGKTLRAYEDTLTTFREGLRLADMDLDSDGRSVGLAAQLFAAGHDLATAPSTHNQRLAVLSSFYKYVVARKLVPGLTTNPIELVERRKVHLYADATALDPETVRTRLAQLDRQTPGGSRDYAILLVALTTGRRVSEIAGLRLKDFKRVGSGKVSIEVHFRHCKGGKETRDQLADVVAAALLAYLKLVYPAGSTNPDAPVWISLDRHGGTYGRPLSVRALQALCTKHLGDHFHALRHSFAQEMERAGANVSDIQARLLHDSLDTTGRYLRSLKRAENDKADILAALFV